MGSLRCSMSIDCMTYLTIPNDIVSLVNANQNQQSCCSLKTATTDGPVLQTYRAAVF